MMQIYAVFVQRDLTASNSTRDRFIDSQWAEESSASTRAGDLRAVWKAFGADYSAAVVPMKVLDAEIVKPSGGKR